MSSLQRAPIDVPPTAGYESRAASIAWGTDRLLDASMSHFPFAGALLRSVLGSDEIEQLIPACDHRASDEPLNNASFLEPVNAAVRRWWEKQPQSDDFDVMDLRYSTVVPGNYSAQFHMDQKLHQGSDMPVYGPVTALAVLRESVAYRLGVSRHNVLNPRDRKFFETIQMGSILCRTHKVTATAGDVLVIPNIKPVFHQAEDMTDDRLTVVYFSGFRAKESVK